MLSSSSEQAMPSDKQTPMPSEAQRDPSLAASGASSSNSGTPPFDIQRDLQDPLSKLNIGFALMSIIPLLICFYLITVKFFSVSILVGINAYYFLTAIASALAGILHGRRVIQQMVKRIVDSHIRSEQLLAELVQLNDQLRQANLKLAQSNDELRATQLQLIQAEKLEAVGQLAAGVAHEVKNPLTAILLGVQFLSKRFGRRSPALAQPVGTAPPAPAAMGTDDVLTILSDIEEATRQADTVIRGLLDFSAPQQLRLAVEQLNPIIEQSLFLVKHELDTARITVIKVFQPDLPPLQLDRNKGQQVFVNLFMNAIHAMSRGGTLTVSSSLHVLSTTDAHTGRRASDPFRSGETVIAVEVSDTGMGISAPHMTKIFDPFFTTKQPGQGTGLGLTVTKKIVELHGGTMELQNRDAGGVEVRLLFRPWAHSSPGAAPAAPS